jgi:undecaprenyl diphosphate synthase
VVTRSCRELGIPFLTLYAFSHENWQRPKPEVDALMRLLNRYLRNELNEMLYNDIRLDNLGDIDRLPRATRQLLKETVERTAGNSGMVLSLALSYGGRPEIVHAARRIAEKCVDGLMRPDEVDETVFNRHLFTDGMPDPDLLIRTGGEYRVSNFLLWQIAYTEIYVTDLYFPDFREEALQEALADYQRRERRFGRTREQVRGNRGF